MHYRVRTVAKKDIDVITNIDRTSNMGRFGLLNLVRTLPLIAGHSYMHIRTIAGKIKAHLKAGRWFTDPRDFQREKWKNK